MDKSKKILKRLELLHPKKIDLSLSRLEKLLKKLGNPQHQISPIIHVAGTNGKGSVVAFLRSILENNKFKINTYTSPHLIRFNERIRINSRLITNNYLTELLEECESYNNGNQITFFEITTAAAFLAFSRTQSDFTLIETGLGGKYDATNIIKSSLCSVITPISMDHMNFLGTTISKIASEKLGILKKNSIAIISKQKKSLYPLIQKKIKQKGAIPLQEGKDWGIINIDSKKNKFSMFYKNKKLEFPYPGLFGNHQIENASTAIATILSLNKVKFSFSNIKNGITRVSWPGRMQKLDK